MILRFHVPFYEEILRIPDFAQDPILTFGYQDIDGDARDPISLLPRLRADFWFPTESSAASQIESNQH
jgi:hypothetical protein